MQKQITPKKASIRQFVNPDDENMGLTKYNLSVFSGAGGNGGFKESLGYVEKSGKRFYLTGLDEHSRNVAKISNSEKKEEVIKKLDSVRKNFEERFDGTSLKSTNNDFWQNIVLEVKSGVKELDMGNIDDQLLYYTILGGGFSQVAPSFEEARRSNYNYKFYLHVDLFEEEAKITITRIRNKAISILEEIYDSNPGKLFYVVKNVLPISKGYNKKSPVEGLYNDLSEYIMGEVIKNGKARASLAFIEHASKDMAELKLSAIIKEALQFKYIHLDDKKQYIYAETRSIVGRNPDEVHAYFLDVANNDELASLSEKIDIIWE